MLKFKNYTNDLTALKEAIFYLSVVIIENMIVPNLIERMNLILEFQDFDNC